MTLLAKADTLEDIEYLEEKIKVSPRINRRTTQGRAITEEVLNACNQKARYIIQRDGVLPF